MRNHPSSVCMYFCTPPSTLKYTMEVGENQSQLSYSVLLLQNNQRIVKSCVDPLIVLVVVHAEDAVVDERRERCSLASVDGNGIATSIYLNQSSSLKLALLWCSHPSFTLWDLKT